MLNHSMHIAIRQHIVFNQQLFLCLQQVLTGIKNASNLQTTMRQKTNHLGHMKVTKICAINTDKEAIVLRFIKLFSGLGCLTEEN